MKETDTEIGKKLDELCNYPSLQTKESTANTSQQTH